MRIVWDQVGERVYETGVDRGVLYLRNDAGAYPDGVAWNGLMSVAENPTGAEPTPFYADNIKYLNMLSTEEFESTIEAYTYPKEFEECDGSAELTPGVTIGQQDRKVFGTCYRTIIGNDIDQHNYGYKLHLIYGALASPTEKSYQTINDSPEPITFSWSLTTTPVEVTGFKPTASLNVDSTLVDAAKMKDLEDILYGTTAEPPRLPLPEEVMTIINP